MRLSVRAALTPPICTGGETGIRARLRTWSHLWVVGSTPALCTRYVACSSVGQSAGLWLRRSAVRARPGTPCVFSSVGRAADF